MFTQQIINTLWQALSVTVKGMIGIFFFMFLFFLIIQLIDRLFPKEIERESSKD